MAREPRNGFSTPRESVSVGARVRCRRNPPPLLTGVSPTAVQNSLQTLTLTGTGLVATPSVRLRSGTFTHDAYSETWVSSSEMRATVSKSSLYPGTYTVELTNPDGQWVALPAAVVVP